MHWSSVRRSSISYLHWVSPQWKVMCLCIFCVCVCLRERCAFFSSGLLMCRLMSVFLPLTHTPTHSDKSMSDHLRFIDHSSHGEHRDPTLNEPAFYGRQTMSRCFAQYVQQPLSGDLKGWNHWQPPPTQEFLSSHTTTTSTTTTLVCSAVLPAESIQNLIAL